MMDQSEIHGMQRTLLSMTRLLLLSDMPLLLRRSITADLPVALLLLCSATCIAAGRFSSISALACLLLVECMLLLAWLMFCFVCTAGGGWWCSNNKGRQSGQERY
jgi:hypothetical protein